MVYIHSLSTALVAASIFSTPGYTAPTTQPSSNYTLVADYSGTNFFSGFTTFTAADPTQGNVNYVGMRYGAEQSYLGYINNPVTKSTNAYIGVDYHNVTANRNSVRLTSKQTFNVGTVLTFDVVHAPVALGTWPALWLLGNVPNAVWPSAGGEADILEWVHDTPFNSMTLHTASGCTVQNSSAAFQGQLQSADCNHGAGSDGCSIQARPQAATSTGSLATAGKAFNDQGGAVYAVSWQNSGLAVYIFPRDALPADLAAGTPNPSSWPGKPLASFSGSGCDFSSSLSTMQIITDTTFCGAWAGKPEVWATGPAQKTGVKTCAEFVEKNPKAFREAYFEIRGIRVWSQNGVVPGVATNGKRDEEGEVRFPRIDLEGR